MATAGTAAQFSAQQDAANAQNDQNARQYDLTLNSMRDNQAELGRQNQQEFAASQQKAEDNARLTRSTDATARVASGEHGVSGNTADALFREISGNGARNQSSIYENYLTSNSQIANQGKVMSNNISSQVNGLTNVAGPSALVAGLKIGASGMDTYSGYKSGKFGQDGNQWKTK
jgi:hypothetical protein